MLTAIIYLSHNLSKVISLYPYTETIVSESQSFFEPFGKDSKGVENNP